MDFTQIHWNEPIFSIRTCNQVINTLNEKMELVYTDLLLCYMKNECVMKTPLHLINPNDENQFLSTSTVYLGVKVLNQIKISAIQQRKDLLKEFSNRCINFIKTSCLQIKKRYDFSNPILPLLNMLTPSVALFKNEGKVPINHLFV